MFYQTLGYKAYRINLNIEGNTHCVTIVNCAEEWCIQDATFNCTYTCGNDRNIKIIIDALENRNGKEVSVIEGENVNTYAIADENYKTWSTMYPQISFIRNKNDCNMYLIDRSVSHYDMYELMYPIFEKDGYESDYKYSLLYGEDVIWKYGVEDFLEWKSRTRDVLEIKAMWGIE